ncbi:MAG: hypothetical protein WDN03_00520 [Rhizomicrobium sp.]
MSSGAANQDRMVGARNSSASGTPMAAAVTIASSGAKIRRRRTKYCASAWTFSAMLSRVELSPAIGPVRHPYLRRIQDLGLNAR